jgi:NTE family protein
VALDADDLVASAAIPLLFRHGTVTGRSYVDGALLANTPLAPALHYEPDVVIIVTTSEETRPTATAPSTLGEMIERLLDHALGGSLRADLAHARTINELCRHDPGDPHKIIQLLLIEPIGLDLGRSLDFSRALSSERIAAGREVGERALAGWRAEGLLAG